jgi:hypothetical protein
MYEILQKLVYLDAIPNSNGNILSGKNLPAYLFYVFAEKAY